MMGKMGGALPGMLGEGKIKQTPSLEEARQEINLPHCRNIRWKLSESFRDLQNQARHIGFANRKINILCFIF
jgi:hypothetical protein